ncbi:type III secretion system protein SsaO [Salmonella enterica subsp. enterica serovar Typhimurium str. ST4581]|nr:type III secretion system protein SsaO [Salmonella enterica subsp. enterica serovar Agona str. SA-4]ESE70047.1 type III secretion system protein SsaO [Salmonella enterica subsp. enterica serovar Typhimurium str. ST4581]EYI26106.1 type III secretion system protein SsaO [Salmonella enterica subsp. enterica serovar Heidelberg str. N18393]
METLLEIIARREKQLRGKLTVLDQQQQAIITEQQICQTRALAVSTRLKELMGWQGTLSCHLLLDKKQQMAGLFTQAQSFFDATAAVRESVSAACLPAKRITEEF